jgi:hypothetical protein
VDINPYEYTFIGGEQAIYSFSASDKIRYLVKFVSSDYLFDGYPDLDLTVFEMVISVVDPVAGQKIPSDAAVGPTIALIFSDFIQHEKQAIVFICDATDGRQKARSRKFSTWFHNRQSRTDMGKFDRIAEDGDRLIYLSLLMSRKHPQLETIVGIFMKLGEEDK